MDVDDNEMAMGGKGGIPDICQFWYTNALFRPIKVRQNVQKFETI